MVYLHEVKQRIANKLAEDRAVVALARVRAEVRAKHDRMVPHGGGVVVGLIIGTALWAVIVAAVVALWPSLATGQSMYDAPSPYGSQYPPASQYGIPPLPEAPWSPRPAPAPRVPTFGTEQPRPQYRAPSLGGDRSGVQVPQDHWWQRSPAEKRSFR